MRNETLKAHVLLFFTTLVACFNYSISKEVMPGYISPWGIIAIRVVSAALVFFIIHSVFIKERIQREDYLQIFLCALFGIALNQLLFYQGLNMTSPINASLMMISIPIIAIIISAIIVKEKITFIKILGIILGATGAVLLLINSAIRSGNSTFTGDLLVLLNATSYGIFLVLVKPLMARYNAFTLVKWFFLIGMVIVLPFGLPDLFEVKWNEIPGTIWLAIGFIVVFTTILNYYFNVGVMRFVNPSIAGIYIYLQPPITSLIAITWGKDELTLEKVAYSILILVGVYLVSKKNNSQL
ncbi:MAG: DMT family transporter [Cytophagaceae bacterium]|nr:DMT family transporter [Cytophagaceae bacterium]